MTTDQSIREHIVDAFQTGAIEPPLSACQNCVSRAQNLRSLRPVENDMVHLFRRALVLVAVYASSVSVVAAEPDVGRAETSAVRATIDRGLAFLTKDALAWRKEHGCVSCHHASLVVWAMHEARAAGHAVDEPVLAELTTWMADSGDGRTSIPRPEERAASL